MFAQSGYQLSNLHHALAQTFEDVPRCGLAGSMLLYPDGRLQEAGGILWNDGSGWNFGRGEDPRLPEFNYLREVDYCSAASMMVPVFTTLVTELTVVLSGIVFGTSVEL